MNYSGTFTLFDKDSQMMNSLKSKVESLEKEVSDLKTSLNKLLVKNESREVTEYPNWSNPSTKKKYSKETIQNAIQIANLSEEQARVLNDYLSSY